MNGQIECSNQQLVKKMFQRYQIDRLHVHISECPAGWMAGHAEADLRPHPRQSIVQAPTK